MLKLAFMRNGEFDEKAGALFADGALQVERFAAHVRHYIDEGQRACVLTSSLARTKASASHLARLFGVRAHTYEALHYDHGGTFVQGLGNHVPKDVDVVMCVSHDKRIAAIVEEVMGSPLFRGRNAEDDLSLLQNLGNGEGVVVGLSSLSSNGKMLGVPYRQPAGDALRND